MYTYDEIKKVKLEYKYPNEEFKSPLSYKTVEYGMESGMKLYPNLKIECNEKT